MNNRYASLLALLLLGHASSQASASDSQKALVIQKQFNCVIVPHMYLINEAMERIKHLQQKDLTVEELCKVVINNEQIIGSHDFFSCSDEKAADLIDEVCDRDLIDYLEENDCIDIYGRPYLLTPYSSKHIRPELAYFYAKEREQLENSINFFKEAAKGLTPEISMERAKKELSSMYDALNILLDNYSKATGYSLSIFESK